MDVVVRTWHWRVTFATAKKRRRPLPGLLPVWCAASRTPNILNNEKVFTVC
jgi:hypothetical protein